MSAQELSHTGFTLIEVMLVLAIAGLIMIIVFLAVAGAQRSQRDRARQDFVNRSIAAINANAGNNNGKYPVAGTAPFPANLATTDWSASGILNVSHPGSLTTWNFSTVNTKTTTAPPVNTYVLQLDTTSTDTPAITGTTCSGTYTAGAVITTMEATNQAYCVSF